MGLAQTVQQQFVRRGPAIRGRFPASQRRKVSASSARFGSNSRLYVTPRRTPKVETLAIMTVQSQKPPGRVDLAEMLAEQAKAKYLAYLWTDNIPTVNPD